MHESAINELGLLEAATSQFRDLINQPRRHHALVQRRKDFLFLCSAMDILGDTVLALHSYVKHSHSDQGLAYLGAFGVLQALVVQQDAVRKLHKIITGAALDLAGSYPEAKEVEDMRVRVAGHPVGGRSASHFMIRYTVAKGGFELWAYDQSGGRTVTEVNLVALILKNSRALCAAVKNLLSIMQAEDKQHKAQFAEQRLADIFTLSTYLSGKLFEAISDKNPIGQVGVGGIRDMLANFESALSERSPHFVEGDHILHDLPRLQYALGKFEQYLNGDESQNANDAYILARYIQVELKGLSRVAQEIDEDYSG